MQPSQHLRERSREMYTSQPQSDQWNRLSNEAARFLSVIYRAASESHEIPYASTRYTDYSQPLVSIRPGAFVFEAANWRIVLELLLFGVFGGVYIVPVYALVQARYSRIRAR